MTRAPMRRGQLIAPFGVGSMVVVRDGVSVMAAGLDHWFKREDGTSADFSEYALEEWRLSRQLQVFDFRLPPDFRTPGRDVPNAGLTIPFVRFPLTHICPKCGLMKRSTLFERSYPRCRECNRILTQAALVVICESGHIQDFPWREWVHHQVVPTCQGDLRFVATGSATLAGQKVKCSCGKERSLNGVTFEGVLTKTLEDSSLYLCQGKRPWLGHEEGESCGKEVVAVLRSASNAYFPQTASAIYIPRGGSEVPQDVVTALEHPTVAIFVSMFRETLDPQMLRSGNVPEVAELLRDFSDADIRAGIQYVLNEKKPETHQPLDEVDFRREEYSVLRRTRNDEALKIREMGFDEYGTEVRSFFSRVTLVEKLRETRALYGFTRVKAETTQNLANLKASLRRSGNDRAWLPAYPVYGEGIFLELNEAELQAWLARNEQALCQRLKPLQQRLDEYRRQLKLEQEKVTARQLIVHTLAHLLINQLVFECGYSAASLRERLYISDETAAPMAALLIYTASGDAEGTMGGLVRMGKPGLLEPVLRKSIEGAAWCSVDPVCMETGHSLGQGPAGLNLAACHGCVLVPETSCEKFNSLLDRGVMIGDLQNELTGFFASLLG